MPTNLPPEYFKIEEEYRKASGLEEKTRLLEELISAVPKHKGTDKLRADLRRRLSKLKDSSSARGKTARHESPYQIDKEGAGQVVVIGPANSGKSSLLNALTNAAPEVAEYPFSTWGPTPGMAQIEDVQVQLIDTPALDRDFVEPDQVDLIRRSDLALILLDIQAFPIEQLTATLEFLEEHRIVPDYRREEDWDRRPAFLPMLVAVNKVDNESLGEDFRVYQELVEVPLESLSISVLEGRGLDELLWRVFDDLEVMRVYSKVPGKEPDLNSPFVMRRGSTVEEFARQVHQDFAEHLKSARLWGSSEFEGQMVSRDYMLQDGDVVELRI